MDEDPPLDRWTFVSVGTALVLLLHADPHFQETLTPLATFLILVPTCRSNWRLWAGASIILLALNLRYFGVHDDHQFLFGYWTVALTFATAAGDDEDRDDILATNARLLIGGTFLLAAFWKCVSPDFVDGTLFEYLLQFHPRMGHVAPLFTEWTSADLHRLLELKETLRESGLQGDRVARGIDPPPGVPRLAQLLAVGALATEIAIPLLFLWPRRTLDEVWTRRARWAGHGALVLFICTTYLLIPVIGFAGILIVMAVAETREEEIRLRWLYVALFVLLPLAHALTGL